MSPRSILLALAVVLGLGACDAGFETPSIVLDLRLLGMRADPPEVVFDFDPEAPTIPDLPPVSVSVLVADPNTPRRLAWSMRACEPNDGDRCDGAEQIIPMGEGIIGDPEEDGSTLVLGSVTADAALLRASLENDPRLGLSGLEVRAEVRVWPEGADPATAIVGVKSLVYAPRIPAERVANRNPIVDVLTIGDPDDPSPPELEGTRCGPQLPWTVPARELVRLDPIVYDEERETYVLPTLDGGVRTITENLRFSWFATSGSFLDEQSGGATDPFGNVPVNWTEYRVPPDPGLVRLWIVVRDERGGASWIERCLLVE